jgi:hypothetical protein
MRREVMMMSMKNEETKLDQTAAELLSYEKPELKKLGCISTAVKGAGSATNVDGEIFNS